LYVGRQSIAYPTVTINSRVLQIRISGTPSNAAPVGLLKFNKGANAFITLLHPEEGAGTTGLFNLHTHGLHVYGGPDYAGDDVSTEVPDGANLTYQYILPKNHAGGTHWVHTHVHMNTALGVAGGALGMIIVNDDPDGHEVPVEIVNAPMAPLIMLHMQPAVIQAAATLLGDTYVSLSPATGVQDFFTVNGYVTPIVELEQGVWTRLRMLHASPTQGTHMLLSSVAASQCSFVLLAKDGVYLPGGPRLLTPVSDVVTLVFTQASRADVLVRCMGTVSATVNATADYAFLTPPPGAPPGPPTPSPIPVFSLRVKARTAAAADTWSPLGVVPCMPSYLGGCWPSGWSTRLALTKQPTPPR
jgi:FtsP/CotA-like multicopper oxidase with cupredoxin domain